MVLFPQSIQLLLDAGSELDVCESEQGRSPLFAAIHQNNAPVVKLLINAGIHSPLTYSIPSYSLYSSLVYIST